MRPLVKALDPQPPVWQRAGRTRANAQSWLAPSLVRAMVRLGILTACP